MQHIECPRCKRKTVNVLADADGVAGKTKCSSCGWTGPKCFAHKWDPNSPKCVGGADPTHWEGDTHVRSRCSFEKSCSRIQEQDKKEALIAPMNMLTKPRQHVEVAVNPAMRLPQQTGPQPPAQTAMTQPPRQTVVQQPPPYNNIHVRMQQQPMRPPTQPQAQYPVQQPVMAVPMAWVPPHQAQVPMYVPQNYPSPGMQMPAYLTVPEPIEQGVVPMFFNSAVRAGGKAICHTFANLFDHFAFGSAPLPPAPPQGQ